MSAPVSTKEDPVCQKNYLDQKAHDKCLPAFSEYEKCAQRVASGKTDAGKHCGGYYGEYWQCIDKANTKALFHTLK